MDYMLGEPEKRRTVNVNLDRQDLEYFEFIKKKFNIKKDTDAVRTAIKIAYDALLE